MHPSSPVFPDDAHNRELVHNVHPPHWSNPEPAPRYNLVVIGAGTAGLVAAAGTAALGGKAALIERHLLGGDCLNTGCVPSKALIRSAQASADCRDARSFGIQTENIQVDFAAVMERVRRIRARISHHDSAERFRSLGADVFFGEARFVSRREIEIAGKRLRFKKALIATGARPVIPEIDGLAAAGFVTNETLFNMTRLPRRLLVVGGGPLGCELAQAFRRLGSEVIIVQKGSQFLPREDPDAARILAAAFQREDIAVRFNSGVKRVTRSGPAKTVQLETNGKQETLTVDEILIGAGRAPNVEGLNLEVAGVKYDQKNGVFVNDHLQTANPDIYAAGDVCLQDKFTHTAEAASRIVVQNALFLGRKRLSALTVPWCTYTDPEIAHVGLYERDAAARGIPIHTFTSLLNELDRAITDGEEEGFVKVHVREGTDKILGATIVAGNAGDLISEISVAMAGGVGLGTISGVIHPYPTIAEAIKRAADGYNKGRLSPRIKSLSTKWLKWRRGGAGTNP